MGDADSTLYAEPSSMAQVYDMMYTGARDIGLMPPRSRKMKKETGKVYWQERMALLRKILSYKDCRRVDCSIVVPTCLRTPMLVLLTSKCMHRYHNPHLQGLFANKYQENGFGYVQPRGDLRDCIVPPDFHRLPELATKALQTLSQEDTMPYASPNARTDTEAATHMHRLCVQSQVHDPDALRRAVFDIMAEAGHGHLLLELEDYATDEGSEVDDIDTPPMSPTRRVIIKTAQKMQPKPQGPTAEELLNPARAKSVPPRHCATALPTKQSPTPRGCMLPVSGQQMDASHNMRAQSKRMSSPAPVDRNKRTKTPMREPDEPVRHSRSLHRCRGGHARSQSCPKREEVFIPAGYKSTYRQEPQKEEKQHQREERQRRSETLKWHLERWEAEKQEVLTHSRSYISRRARGIRSTLHPMDEAVRGFKVFGDNAAIYAAYIMATLEWEKMYRHYGGRDAVPVLPEWLTTYIGVTKSLTTNADLPRKCVHIGNPDVRLNFMVTWQWMADLLQFWTDLSGPRLFGSIFCYPSVLAEQLMVDINPSLNTTSCDQAAYREQHSQLAECSSTV